MPRQTVITSAVVAASIVLLQMLLIVVLLGVVCTRMCKLKKTFVSEEPSFPGKTLMLVVLLIFCWHNY